MTPSCDEAPSGSAGRGFDLKRGAPVPYGLRTVIASPGETPLAAALYLVTRSHAAHTPLVNGVRAVIINADDADTDAEIKAAAADAVTANMTGGSVSTSIRDNYFDTVTEISDLVAGPLKDAGDAYIVAGNGDVRKVG